MKTKKRSWIRSAIKEAENCDFQMPWARGARREAFISRRRAQALARTPRASA
ncbi:hypothetical protein SAMN05216257_101621 [Meinhardsimonia xiamenensis]|jgi:hypothetical protein|uniref:Uncharacterized protein n=1 Tax=Meinhardsimonia xiamenensis TaxID=990712 RepID=A0A1G8Z8A3_9RHOB|nr:hypothetical protein [Meinhardsimonia xiamenensis]PRX37596.1 hypothetical protein LV81_01376 [Meinhardsimonia xiamenensis]SDK11326.1 hypothetical protein SAMN05216257_101621 [Meinhardsimonia xiamenensis]